MCVWQPLTAPPTITRPPRKPSFLQCYLLLSFIMAQHVAIDVQNAKYDYEYKDGSRTPALRDCTLQIRHGDRVVLMGANGSGKSTLLGAIAGMHKVIDGKVTVLGSDAFTDTNLQQRVARIGQAWPDNANWCETVRQTAATYPRLDWDRFESLCKLLHVNPDWRVDHCSCGMKRKIQVLLGLIYPKEVCALCACPLLCFTSTKRST